MNKALRRAMAAVAASGISFAAGIGVVLAQVQNGTTQITLVDPLGGQSFTTVLNNIIAFLSTAIAIPLTIIMVLVGAFQMMTSAGDPEKFSQGRKTLTYAAIGFAIALLATSITSLISNVITGQ